MFDIGWTEVVVIIIIACLVLEVKDLPKIFKAITQIINYCNDLIKEIKSMFNDTVKHTKKVIDLDGKEHLAYTIEDIMPDIRKEDGTRRSRKRQSKSD